MPWPVTDFDDVTFNDGSGADEVEAIHLAIKERAEATGHSAKDGDYSEAFTGTIWLSEPDGNSERLYLKDKLESLYDGVVDLVSGDSSVEFTETSGRSDSWTMANLITDIGMGEFVDTLTKPANHLPFLWLHEALDRLIYGRRTGDMSRNVIAIKEDTDSSSPDTAWTKMLLVSPVDTTFPTGGNPSVGFRTYSTSVERARAHVEAKNVRAGLSGDAPSGVLQAVDYVCLPSMLYASTLSDLSVTIGGAIAQAIEPVNELQYLEGDPSDVSLTSEVTNLTVTLSSALPSTNPFPSGSPGFSFGTFYAVFTSLIYYFDIAGELADQA